MSYNQLIFHFLSPQQVKRMRACIVLVLLWVNVTMAFVGRVPSSGETMTTTTSRDIALSVATITSDGNRRTIPSSLPTTVAVVPMVAQRWRKSTKQVATLGPASNSKEMIEKLFLAGADVFRLNFSHGSQEQKGELLKIIREIEEKYSHPIAILGDLQGPKLRVSTKLSLDSMPFVKQHTCTGSPNGTDSLTHRNLDLFYTHTNSSANFPILKEKFLNWDNPFAWTLTQPKATTHASSSHILKSFMPLKSDITF